MFKQFVTILFTSLILNQTASAQEQSFPERSNKKSGYFNTSELSFSKGFLKDNSSWYGGLQTINGYRFNEHISAGIGVGVDQYFYKNFNSSGFEAGETYLPVFTDVRFYIGKGNTKPFFSQAVGYMFCIRRFEELRDSDFYKNKGGIMINPAFGINTPISQNTSFNISLGYRFQEVTIKDLPINFSGYNVYLLADSRTFSAHYLTLKAGVTF